jgi:predicted CoA-binding protein
MDDVIDQILASTHTIAVVGCSTHAYKAAHTVPATMQAAGYTVVPVHLRAVTILGVSAYPLLTEVPVHVDLVNVFRPADEAPGIAEAAVEIGASALWLQLGLRSEQAAEIARAAGLGYVENRCISVELARRRAGQRGNGYR